MSEQNILEQLRTSGHRLTDQRRKLVDILLQANGPLTAEEIYVQAREKKVAANLSTIYRNLSTFCEMGWLDAVPGANGERYYQVRQSEEQTMSVLCLDCGQLTAMAIPPSGLNEAVRSLGFDAASLRVTLAAHCEHVCPWKEK